MVKGFAGLVHAGLFSFLKNMKSLYTVNIATTGPLSLSPYFIQKQASKPQPITVYVSKRLMPNIFSVAGY
jgi:hypothetical protein